MPSIAEAPVSPLSGRKRRRDDHNTIDVQMKLSSPHIPRHTSFPDSTPIFSDKVRDEIHQGERRHILPKPKQLHDSKRQRIEKVASEDTTHLTHDLRDHNFTERQQHNNHHESSETVRPFKKMVDLSPCHICRRKPTIRSELDSYADCEGCGKRTCYICIRECLGSTVAVEKDTEMGNGFDGLAFDFQEDSERKQVVKTGHDTDQHSQPGKIWDTDTTVGHKGMVCSRCCVERGPGGEVYCLGCVRAEKRG
ncbi:hypothetical protein G7Y89_g11740 [Cudoniella acicularis]|uniref:Uncharacterized protein n=1 Tax=Cudoniella acicularis TaxID=354080 RepID=A0A8H4RAB6_9HELO|nr:hypothetical protein G7Y89_g11740 [Cudoniella acicularis]